MSDLSAFVLAGGKSSRMDREKAFLELAGRSLLARALELAASVTSEVCIVGPGEKFSSIGRVVEDIYPGRGPLGGIHTALSSSQTEFNLILAVDTPFLRPEFLHYLVAQARAGDALVTLPRAGGGWQPLCAVYRRAFLPLAQEALAAGRNRIDPLFAAASVRALEEEELKRLAFDPGMFDNLNTPEEWEQARRRA
jgi:molybdopterin-guanine dinucleotide biosynthesis protein A